MAFALLSWHSFSKTTTSQNMQSDHEGFGLSLFYSRTHKVINRLSVLLIFVYRQESRKTTCCPFKFSGSFYTQWASLAKWLDQGVANILGRLCLLYILMTHLENFIVIYLRNLLVIITWWTLSFLGTALCCDVSLFRHLFIPKVYIKVSVRIRVRIGWESQVLAKNCTFSS